MAKRSENTERTLELFREVEALLEEKGIPAPGIQTLGIEGDPLRVLLSTILSLRTRDPVMEAASRRLFERASDLGSIDLLSEEDLVNLIYPVGFYRTKARTIKQIAKILLEKWNGAVPSDLDSLLALPGVGLKTATLVLGAGYGMEILAVDTHVHRIAHRWGIAKTKTPDETYWYLDRILPPSVKRRVNPVLVSFGQSICLPVSPKCSECTLESHCPRIGVTHRR